MLVHDNFYVHKRNNLISLIDDYDVRHKLNNGSFLWGGKTEYFRKVLAKAMVLMVSKNKNK